jgi:hypothetical protein
MRFAYAIALTLTLCQLLPQASLCQTTVERQTVTTATSQLSMVLTYPHPVSYGTIGGDFITIRMSASDGSNLSCVQGYLDFKYILRDASGNVVPIDSRTLADPPADETNIDPRYGTPRWCKMVITDRKVVVNLSALYPHLKEGDYTLDIRFDPRTPILSSLKTAFPQLHLKYAP